MGVLQLTDYLPNVTQLIGDVQAVVGAEVNRSIFGTIGTPTARKRRHGKGRRQSERLHLDHHNTGSSPTTAWVPASDAVSRRHRWHRRLDGVIGSGTISVARSRFRAATYARRQRRSWPVPVGGRRRLERQCRRLLDRHPEYQHRRPPAGREQPGQRHAQHGRQRRGGLTKSGSGPLYLLQNNTYSGNTAIFYGVLQTALNNALPTGTTVTLGDPNADTSGTLLLGESGGWCRPWRDFRPRGRAP